MFSIKKRFLNLRSIHYLLIRAFGKNLNSFKLKAYVCVLTIGNPLCSLFNALGPTTVVNPIESSFLIFLHRTVDKTDEIFALHCGNRGFQPVQAYSDYHFPQRIALRLLDSEERCKETSKRITGPIATSSETLRGNIAFDPSLIHKIYTGFTARLRRDASLLSIPAFRKKNGKVPKHPAEIEIHQGSVKIHKSLSLPLFAEVLSIFSKIARKEKTTLYKGPDEKSPPEETDQKEGFEFLLYFTPVSYETSTELQRKLSEELASALLKESFLDWELAHPIRKAIIKPDTID
jgi:hypothetical protein